jgi:ABC-2 type transport system permease protein
VRGALALAAHSFRRARALVLTLGLVFAGFQALAALMASTFDESQLFARIGALVPSYVRQALGASLFTMMSFTGMCSLGYVHFVVIGSLIGLSIAVATEPAAEIERGFSDLLMSRPVPRASAITRSALMLLGVATLANGMMLAGTWAGLSLFAAGKPEWPSARLLLSLAAGLWMLMVCWGGLAMAAGAASRRRGVAGAVAGLAAVVAYLADIVSRVWQPARAVGPFSPFHYFNPIDIVSGKAVEPGQAAVLLGVGACGIAAAYLIYARRDL